jgi:melanoma-associated antigen
MIVAIISLSGGTISEEKLDHSLFRKTRVPDSESTSALARMCREGFITKITDNSSGQTSVEYIVGPRGKIQIGEEGVKSFVKAVWAEDDKAAQADLEKQLDRTLKLAKAPEKKADDATPIPAPKKRGRPPKRTEGTDEEMDEDEDVQDLEDEDDEDISDDD